MGCDGGPRTRMLRDFKIFTKTTAVEVMILWTWNNSFINVNTFNFIIMDTNGYQIHGWVRKNVLHRFDLQLYENNVIRLQDFRIIEKKIEYYCVVQTPHNIELIENSKMEKIEEDLQFPKPQFNFIQFGNFQCVWDNKDILIDVVGMFERIDPPKQISTKNKVQEVHIRNERNEVARITFWNDSIDQLPSDLTDGGKVPMLVVASTFATSFHGKVRLNSTMATKVYVVPDFPQSLALMECMPALSLGSPEKMPW